MRRSQLTADAIAKLNVVLLRCATRAERNTVHRVTMGERIFEMTGRGMSPKQIAEELDLDRDDVNRSIYRTRKRMKRKAAEVDA